MPEPPDFDRIAARLAEATGVLSDQGRFELLREELRQVWHARGAADIAILETELEPVLALVASVVLKTLQPALRTLDR